MRPSTRVGEKGLCVRTRRGWSHSGDKSHKEERAGGAEDLRLALPKELVCAQRKGRGVAERDQQGVTVLALARSPVPSGARRSSPADKHRRQGEERGTGEGSAPEVVYTRFHFPLLSVLFMGCGVGLSAWDGRKPNDPNASVTRVQQQLQTAGAYSRPHGVSAAVRTECTGSRSA